MAKQASEPASPDAGELLLPRLAAGDPQAAAACLSRYGGLVWSLARRHAPMEADDAVQEIFIEIWKSAGRYDPRKASEAAFIAMIARRRLIDRHRRAARHPQTDPIDHLPESICTAPARHVEAAAEASLAGRAIQELDDKEREVLLLSVVEGYSHRQIADRTGIPLGTVKTYIRRGLLRVQKRLAGSGSLKEVRS